MARDSVTLNYETAIGEKEFVLQALDGVSSGKLFVWLGKKVGKAFASAASEEGGVKDISGAIGILFENIQPEDFEYLVKSIFKECEVPGVGELTLNRYGSLFQGKHFMNGLKLIGDALQLNYGSFFEAVGK